MHTALEVALSVLDTQDESWEMVDDFKQLEVRSKYFKDLAAPLSRYDDGMVGGDGCSFECGNGSGSADHPMAEHSAKMAQTTSAEPVPRPSSSLPEASPPPRLHVVFDTETTGLYDAHVVQLAYIVFTDDGTEVKRYNKILKLLPGKRIDPRAVDVHRINMSKMHHEGVEPVKELNDFVAVCADVIVSGGKLIAHNAAFDVKAVNTTLSAWETFPVLVEQSFAFCTMKNSKIHSPLTDRRGWRKNFRNDELYAHLFGKEPDLGPLHDALTDILVTKANYLEAAKRGWW